MSYTLYIYKQDRRCKTGERLYSTHECSAENDDRLRERIQDLETLYPSGNGWRLAWTPKMKTVRNLMTGRLVEIPYDTPRVCDPSTELYWSH
jgi:hypothetical protein